MKLRTKFALLVTFCTLLLLGSYYLLSIHNANNAIVDFSQRTSVTIGNTILDDDELIANIEIQNHLLNASQLLSYLLVQYPDHHFIVFKNKAMEAESFTKEGLSLTVTPEKGGLYSYAVQQLDYAPIVISANRPPTAIDINGNMYGLFWVPKNLISRSEEGQSLRQQINNDFTNALVLLSGLAILLSWLGAWYFLKPLKDIKRRFKALADGDLDTRIELKRNDEIGEIIISFNQLAQWLQTLHRQYKQMSSDLAHELKTPLTSMQSRIEALEDGLIKPDAKQYALLSKEIKTINRVVEDLCLLSLTESKQLVLNLQSVHIASFTQDIYDKYQLKAKQTGVEIELELNSDSKCQVDQLRLTQVVNNLIDNAFKYGMENNYLKLSVNDVNWAGTDAISISVKDHGVGLTKEQQQQVFDRFYRTQHSRHDKHSLGLGLPICKQLTELMQGQLTVESELNKGCEFILMFKKQ